MKRSRLAIASLWPLGLALAVLLAAGTAEGQTPWTKDPANPVLEAGDPGAWDQGGVVSGAVLFDGSTYHMWYAGLRTIPPVWPDADIGYAWSQDGVTWNRHPDPVLVRDGTWDSAGICPGAVVWDGALYHMWYVGGTSSSFTQTGYATSPDGVTWTPYGGNPVLTGDPAAGTRPRRTSTAVIADGGTYLAWYNGCPAAGSPGCAGLCHLTGRGGLGQTPGSGLVAARVWMGRRRRAKRGRRVRRHLPHVVPRLRVRGSRSATRRRGRRRLGPAAGERTGARTAARLEPGTAGEWTCLRWP